MELRRIGPARDVAAVLGCCFVPITSRSVDAPTRGAGFRSGSEYPIHAGPADLEVADTAQPASTKTRGRSLG
jgi:hypothetical protein